MNKKTKSFLLSVLTLSFIFSSCSSFFNDLQKRKNQNLFNITIQETSNGTVTAAKSSGIKAGEEVILTVTATSGYELKTISVTNTQNKDVAVAAMEQGISYKFTMPASDVTVGAAFGKTGPVDITEPGDLSGANGNTIYRVEHYQQDVDDTSSYTLYAIQKKKGDAGTDTAAIAKDYPGFTSLSFTQKKIASDGSTVVEIYYNRKTITYTFDPNGGNWDGSTEPVTVSGLYGAGVNKTDPQKPGYSLTWSTAVPLLFGPENVTYTANWTANTNTPYTVRIYLQNVEGGENYTLDNEFIKTGTTDTNTYYNADSKTGFNVQTFEQVNINGDESTVLNVYYNRIAYTVTFVTNGGNSMANQEILYQASPTQIPVRDGYTFFNWYTDSSYNNVFDSNTGITKNITLYAFWIDNSITYRFHETVERLPAGMDGTFGTSGEYVLFGDYPQSLLTDNTVTVDETVTMKMGSWTVYGGSDGNLYYKYDSKYFKVEPIKWRVIWRQNNKVFLFAENILDIRSYDYNGQYIYTFSMMHDFLNTFFLSKAFTEAAQNYIEITTVDCDTIYYYDYDYYDYDSYGEVLDYYSNDKIFILENFEISDSSTFPDNSSLIRTYTGFSAYQTNSSQGTRGQWWLRTSEYGRSYTSTSIISAVLVGDNGDTLYGDLETRAGVVPALSIYLPPAETN